MFEGPTTRHPILTRRQMLMTGAAALVVASRLPGGGAIGDDGAQSIVVCRLTPWDAKAAEFAVRATLIRQDGEGISGRLNFTSIDPNAPATPLRVNCVVDCKDDFEARTNRTAGRVVVGVGVGRTTAAV